MPPVHAFDHIAPSAVRGRGLFTHVPDFTTHGTTLINIWGDTATDRKILACVFEKVFFDISTCVNGVILFENRYLDISNM